MNIPTLAKCPKCGHILTSVLAGHTDINVSFGNSYHGIAYACPSCQTCVGVQMDPVSLKNDTVNELFQKLRRANS